jgi:hypothetical protein
VAYGVNCSYSCNNNSSHNYLLVYN